MGEKTIISIAQEEDFGAIAEIYNEYIREGGSTMQQSLYNGQMIGGWVENFSSREKLYALKKNEEVIGWGIIKRYSDREGYRFSCETAIYITKPHLRSGYGSLMKKYLIEECKALDYHHLIAKIWASNEASIQYNLKLGYTIVGTQKEIGYMNGKWLDVVIMQYLI